MEGYHGNIPHCLKGFFNGQAGDGISPQCIPWLLSKEAKEISSCLIPRLLLVFTWQLEILVTSLNGFQVSQKGLVLTQDYFYEDQ